MPIYHPPYPVNDQVRVRIKAELAKLLKYGLIRVATQTNWASPAVAVVKKNGELRQCVDFTRINKITTSCHFPIPNISDILRRLGQSTIFSTLDGKQGFHQIKMHPNSIAKTCTIFPWGAYEWLVLPYGLKNAPSEFSRIMFLILGDLPFVEIYIDDIIIHSRTAELHFQHLSEVFRKLKEVNFKLNPKKCYFAKSEINLLGHTVSSKGIQMDKTKVEAVAKFQRPLSARDVQIFLGLTGYYRVFIRGYAETAKPLIELTHKGENSIQTTKKRKQSYYVPFIWNESCEQAFKTLKDKLCENPILVHFNPSLPRVVHTDSSGYACGVILACINEQGREQVIAYGSRLLSKQEKMYTISEKEYLAIIYAIKKFHAYLSGTKFEVYTDHLALQSVFKLKDPTGRLFRMKMLHMPYDCVVKFRKGKAHTNVDALSRLIQVNHEQLADVEPLDINKEAEMTLAILPQIQTESSELVQSEANVNDIYNDPHLMLYVKEGKHTDGANTKQINRVLEQAKHYLYLNPVIYYRKDVDSSRFPFVVPPIEPRKSLIEAAHAMGHFQTKTTVDRLQELYHWKGMTKEVQSHIEKCHPCIRNEPKPEVNHPAHATEIKYMSQRIGIDCIGPLKKSSSNNKHICVITEYLTKTAFARPMKGKSAEDVAEVLWLYISIYGPPKEILSDQGTEFINSVIKQLTTMCGIDHRITSPYRPQTNGQTERQNQTLVRALRKHCEDDVETWDKWIPFVIIAYNTRKHSTTGFSPYNLMFGRLMNHFEDYQDTGEQLSLTKRIEEIKNQYENLQPDAKANIEKRQAQQKIQQDKSHKVVEERFNEGELVTLKSLKIRGKMQPPYYGTYRITGHTKNGNYTLETVNGKALKNSFISSRLKRISDTVEEDDPNAHVEIDYILKHRKYNKKTQYLVKWKNREDSTWQDEADFDTLDVIDEYWAKVHKTPTVQLAFTKLNSFVNLITLAMLMSTVLPNTNAIKIHDKFKFCEIHDNKAVWDIPESCQINNQFNQERQTPQSFYVLSKKSNEVSGTGWLCQATNRVVTTSVSFWNTPSIIRNERNPVELTREDCREMVNTKKCNNRPMKCSGDFCESEFKPEEKYSWFSTETTKWTECQIYSQQIDAELANTKILTSRITLSSCLARDLYCKLQSGIIIWDSDLIKECPYEWIKTITLEKFSNLLINKESNTVFQPTRNTTICDNLNVLTTAEGSYLSQDKQVLQLQKGGESLKAIDELLLTEIDYNQMSLLTLVTNLFALTNSKLCQLYKSFVNLYSKIDDEFFTFSDFTGNEAILYSSEGQIFLPTCVNVNEIILIPATKICYRDVPVKLTINNKTLTAFLTKEKIIRVVSKQVPCPNNHVNIHLPSSSRIISMRENTTTIGDDSMYKHIPLTLQHMNVTTFNFHHDKQIISSINLVKQTAKIATITEGVHGDFFVKEDHMTSLRSQVEKIIDNLPSPLEWLWRLLWRALTFLAASVSIILVVVLVYAACARRRELPIPYDDYGKTGFQGLSQ